MGFFLCQAQQLVDGLAKLAVFFGNILQQLGVTEHLVLTGPTLQKKQLIQQATTVLNNRHRTMNGLAATLCQSSHEEFGVNQGQQQRQSHHGKTDEHQHQKRFRPIKTHNIPVSKRLKGPEASRSRSRAGESYPECG